MQRAIRYQGAIIRDDHILLIQHRHHSTGHSYWLLPGGGIEVGETAEACLEWEIREETHLQVCVLDRLSDDPDLPAAPINVCIRTCVRWWTGKPSRGMNRKSRLLRSMPSPPSAGSISAIR